MEAGYTKADSRNLPYVNVDMVVIFFVGNKDFSSVENKGTKLLRSTRESYGDNAIGFVQVRREGEMCYIKCQITPEHKIRKEGYRVTAVINEGQSSVEACQCEDCAASAGGCKHAAAVLLWLHRRSEEPSVTSVECYWKKSRLAKCATSKAFIKCKEMSDVQITKDFSEVNILSEFLDTAEANGPEASILRYFQKQQPSLNIHKQCSMLLGKLDNPHTFLELLAKEATPENVQMIFNTTKDQSDSPLWFEMRYGRITGSILHEAAHCRTMNGSLLNRIMGEQSKFNSLAMNRGKKLEKEVIKVVDKKEKIKIQDAGLLLSAEYPILGATPDGITKDYTVEVKCPSTNETVLSYVKNKKISPKFWSQMQIQMYFSKRKTALFCIAHPDFEKTKSVDVFRVPFDDSIVCVMNKATEFWINSVFPKLKDIYNN